MFEYDYTLEESGVEIEEKSNKQVRHPDLNNFSIKKFHPLKISGFFQLYCEHINFKCRQRLIRFRFHMLIELKQYQVVTQVQV